MTDSQERRVRAESWRDDVSQALQEGYTWLYPVSYTHLRAHET